MTMMLSSDVGSQTFEVSGCDRRSRAGKVITTPSVREMYGKQNIFEGLARRGWPGFAFYVHFSFLSCHQRDFPYGLAGLRRPQCVPNAALRAVCASAERRESCTGELGVMKDLCRGHDASRTMAHVSEGRPTLKVMVANTSRGLIS